MADAGLQLLIEIDDKGTPKVTKFQGRWESMKRGVLRGTGSISKSWTRLQGTWGGLERRINRGLTMLKFGLAGLAAASVVVGAKFEQSMAKVASVAGATREQFRTLTLHARAWGAITAFSASQVADAMYSLASAGQRAHEIIKSVGGVLMFAGAGATSMGEAAESIVQALKMFGLAAGQTNRVVNVFAAGISASMLTADRLKESMAAVGATAAAMNLSLEETVGQLGLLHNAGMLGSIAGTRLKNVLVRLAAPNTALKNLLGDVSIETHGLAGVMQHLADVGAKTGDVFKAFGRIAGPAALTFMRAGQDEMNRMTDVVTGTSKAWIMYQQQQDTVIGDFKRFKSAIEESMIATFEAARPQIRQTLQTLTKWVGESRKYIIAGVAATIEWIDKNKELIKHVTIIAGKVMLAAIALKIFVATAKLYLVVQALLTPVVKLAALGFTSLAGAIGLSSTAMATLKASALKALGPVAAALGVALAASAGIHKVLSNWSEQYRAFADAVGLASKAIVEEGLGKLGGAISDVLEKVFSSLSRGFDLGLEGVENQMSGFLDNINKMIGEMEIKLPTVGVDLEAAAIPPPPVFAMGTLPVGFRLERETFEELNKAEGMVAGMIKRVRQSRIDAAEQAMIADIAAYMRPAVFGEQHTREWLDRKIELIRENESQILQDASKSAYERAEAMIGAEQEIAEAKIAHQEAVWQHWMMTHQAEMLFLSSMEAGYDTFFNTILDKEMTGKERREAMWASMKQSFVRNTGEMIKFYVKNWIKGLILAEAASEKFHLKEKIQSAKMGAVRAYSAFASIPLIGPALGAAAAAAAFAFLIAFHKGGLIGGYIMNQYRTTRERPILAEEGEYITRRRSVTRETLPILQEINRTGRAPAGGSTINVSFPVTVMPGIDERDIDRFIEELEDVVGPALEDLAARRRLNIKTQRA